MGYRSTVQILLVIISVVIVFTYIRPSFQEMKSVQDETQEYKEALENATTFNQELQRLLSVANSYSSSELRLLERYLPDRVDVIAVMRDIETIVKNNKMALTGLSSELSGTEAYNPTNVPQGQANSDTKENSLYVQQFVVETAGTYDQFKLLLQDFERNAYPLEVVRIGFIPGEGTLYTFSIVLETYALNGNDQME